MSRDRILLTGVLGLSSIFFAMDTRGTEGPELPAAAAAAVKSLYPTARILDVGLERERGVAYYEVAVSDGEGKREIEVTEDGTIGEIETEVALAELPKAAKDGILKSTGSASLRQIERHEVRGVPENGKFVAVNPPLVFFEAEYALDGVWKEISVTAEGALLPADAEEAPEEGEGDKDDDD